MCTAKAFHSIDLSTIRINIATVKPFSAQLRRNHSTWSTSLQQFTVFSIEANRSLHHLEWLPLTNTTVCSNNMKHTGSWIPCILLQNLPIILSGIFFLPIIPKIMLSAPIYYSPNYAHIFTHYNKFMHVNPILEM